VQKHRDAARTIKKPITFTLYGEVTLMELAFIAIIIAAIVLVLQIVSLAQIAGIRKSLQAPKDVRPAPPQQGDRFEKRPPDFRRQDRHDRRPYPDQRPQQQAAPASTPIDPVEKSLRDINLRLKSAEREQESARRKIQDNFSGGDQPRNRDDRDRNRGNRDRNYQRNPRRDNWQDRNRSGGIQQQQPAPSGLPQQQRTEPFVEKKETVVPAPESPAPVQQSLPAAVQNTGDAGVSAGVSDFSADQNSQHGRNFIVKRRMLKDELPKETGAESTSVEDAPIRAPQASAAPAAPLSPAVHTEEETRIGGPDTPPDGEIRFGRRRFK
jgi:hypothetical protein